jgi:hypothetical protein
VSRWLSDSDDDVPFDQATNVAGAQLALTLMEDTVTGLREWVEKLTIVAVSEAALLQTQQSRAPNAVILRLEAQFTESDGVLETLPRFPRGSMQGRFLRVAPRSPSWRRANRTRE